MHIAPTPRHFLTLTGPDAERYLNGQVTNDVRLATAKKSIQAAVTDAKGKLQAIITIHRTADDRFLIESQTDTEELQARLDQYLIADDAEWQDAENGLHFSHIFPVPENHTFDPSIIAREINRYGEIGLDLIGQPNDLKSALAEDKQISQQELEALRIERCIAAWGSELTTGMLPQEAGIEDSHISFNKGCYIGQEVISRIKSVGRVNRSLKRLLIESGELTTGDPLLLDGKEIGEITSISSNQALGFIHRKADEAETFLTTHGAVLKRLS